MKLSAIIIVSFAFLLILGYIFGLKSMPENVHSTSLKPSLNHYIGETLVMSGSGFTGGKPSNGFVLIGGAEATNFLPWSEDNTDNSYIDPEDVMLYCLAEYGDILLHMEPMFKWQLGLTLLRFETQYYWSRCYEILYEILIDRPNIFHRNDNILPKKVVVLNLQWSVFLTMLQIQTELYLCKSYEILRECLRKQGKQGKCFRNKNDFYSRANSPAIFLRLDKKFISVIIKKHCGKIE